MKTLSFLFIIAVACISGCQPAQKPINADMKPKMDSLIAHLMENTRMELAFYAKLREVVDSTSEIRIDIREKCLTDCSQQWEADINVCNNIDSPQLQLECIADAVNRNLACKRNCYILKQ